MKEVQDNSNRIFLAVLAVIFIGSFFVLFQGSPEHVVSWSEDRRLSIEAQSRFSNSIQISKLSSINSPLYLIYSTQLQGDGMIEGANVVFHVEDFLGEKIELNELVVFMRDSKSSIYKELPTLVSEQNKTVETTVDLSKAHDFGVGKSF